MRNKWKVLFILENTVSLFFFLFVCFKARRLYGLGLDAMEKQCSFKYYDYQHLKSILFWKHSRHPSDSQTTITVMVLLHPLISRGTIVYISDFCLGPQGLLLRWLFDIIGRNYTDTDRGWCLARVEAFLDPAGGGWCSTSPVAEHLDEEMTDEWRRVALGFIKPLAGIHRLACALSSRVFVPT